MRALLAAHLPVRQVNPFKLRQFAMASGVLDPLDARMMASFVAVVPTRPAPRGRRRQPSGWSRCSAQRREGRPPRMPRRLLEDAMLQPQWQARWRESSAIKSGRASVSSANRPFCDFQHIGDPGNGVTTLHRSSARATRRTPLA